MKRKVLKVVKDDIDNGLHLLIVKVEAGDNTFYEPYVGVNKSHPYWSNFKYTEERDARVKNVSYHAFKKLGSRMTFNSYEEMVNAAPIDGAWLSYARLCTESVEGYEFLQPGYFYYGAGFCIQPYRAKLSTDENCLEAAHTQLARMKDFFNFIFELVPVLKVDDLSEEDLKQIIEESKFKDKHNGLFPLLYMFHRSRNSKVWQLGNSDYYIFADTKKVEHYSQAETNLW